MLHMVWLQIVLGSVPLITAVVADGIRTRSRLAVLESRTGDLVSKVDRTEDRIERHLTSYQLHARPRGT